MVADRFDQAGEIIFHRYIVHKAGRRLNIAS